VEDETEGVHGATIDETEEGEEERVAEGRVDEGEKIVSIIVQMEREDEEVFLVEMEGYDSDEGRDAVPAG
jgi:hypothetical protein